MHLVTESGEAYVAVLTESLGQPNTYTAYHYVYKNPVTLEKSVLDDEDNPVLDEEGNPTTEYVPSKLGMLKEPIEFLLSGGSKVVKLIDGLDHWLIKMPLEAVLDEAFQPDLDKPIVEDWTIVGTEQENRGTGIDTVPIPTVLPVRAVDYSESFDVPPFRPAELQDAWKVKVQELIDQRYG